MSCFVDVVDIRIVWPFSWLPENFRQIETVPFIDTYFWYSIRFSTDLREAFILFDVNRDGRITASELHAVLRFLGIQTTQAEVCQMIKDADCDGKISCCMGFVIDLAIDNLRQSRSFDPCFVRVYLVYSSVSYAWFWALTTVCIIHIRFTDGPGVVSFLHWEAKVFRAV